MELELQLPVMDAEPSLQPQATRVSLQAIWPQNFFRTFPQMGQLISGRALAPVKALKALTLPSVANTRVQSRGFSHLTIVFLKDTDSLGNAVVTHRS